MQKTYHIGLVKDGNRVIVEIGDTVDHLSCELWKYMGERINTVENLMRNRAQVLAAINKDFGTSFTRVTIRRIAARDLTARHKAVPLAEQ